MDGTAIENIASVITAKPRVFWAIFTGGVITGVLDLAYAILVYSPKRPILVPQTIASGLLGAKAYRGGAETAALGVLLHFVIAIGAAAVYYLASRKITLMLDHAVLCGMVFGALVYLFMHTFVVPLSAAPHSSAPAIYKVFEFIEHWFCVGLPIALSVRYFSR
ncbi:MAG TPA: hypothetical protein VJN93_12235 [Candidatus Acidoferrum sp.]|nr:hypothetical protein [Candidatus Acidoferrum sp.]